MATTPNLLRLPPELMLRISTHLTTSELASFRHTCKQVETNLFESFAREFFTKRQFMLEEVSIQALVGIANHKTLAPYLKEVIISVDKLVDARSHPREHPGEPDAFLVTGHAHAMLADAFSKLPLRTIGIRDYDGRGRWRDGKDAAWRSYGWSTVDGARPGHFRPRMNAETILPLLLYSLNGTSTGLERLEVFLRRTGLPDASFDLSPSFMQPNAVHVLSNLKTLLLSLQIGRTRGNQTYAPHINNQSFPSLKDFLRHTPLLEHLRLNFDTNEQPSWCSATFLTWFGTSPEPGVDMAPAPVTLDHLTTLDLGMVHVIPSTLLRIVLKFTKLEALSLWKITLQGTREDLNNPEFSDGFLWPHYLRKLGDAFKAPGNVKTLMVGWPTECTGGPMISRAVKFAGKTNTDSNGKVSFEDVEDVVTYRKRVGSDLCGWLDEISGKAFVPPSIDSDADDDEDEDSQGDDSEGDDSEGEEVMARAMEADDLEEERALREYGE